MAFMPPLLELQCQKASVYTFGWRLQNQIMYDVSEVFFRKYINDSIDSILRSSLHHYFNLYICLPLGKFLSKLAPRDTFYGV